MITTMSLVNICHHTKLKHFFSCDENFLRFILNNFQICNTILLTIVTMLYITSPQLIYLITGSLYLLTPFTHFTYPQTPSPLATTHLFSVSVSVVLFCFEKPFLLCGETVSLLHCWWKCKMVQILEKSWTVSYKTKYATTLQASNCTHGCLSQRSENLCSHKNLYTNVHSSIICDSPKMETIQMSFNR